MSDIQVSFDKEFFDAAEKAVAYQKTLMVMRGMCLTELCESDSPDIREPAEKELNYLRSEWERRYKPDEQERAAE